LGSFVQTASIASRLREAMEKRNKKQADLVKETGINRSAISRYLSGEYEPKSKPIYELAKALDVSEQWLMGYDAPMERPQEQKENDRAALVVKDIHDRLEKEKEFRELIEKISSLNLNEIRLLNSLNKKQVDFIWNYLSSLDLPD